jgi:hypothetical protein
MFLTVASAQDWFGIWAAYQDLPVLDRQMQQKRGEIHHENLVVIWSVTAENCNQGSQGVYYSDKKGEAKVTVHFEIQILENT